MNRRHAGRHRNGGKWVALLLAVGAVVYFSRGFFERFRKEYPANAFFQVKRADMLISLAEEGALRALNETVVRSGLDGVNRIIHLVPEGSYVEKGDLLVELDSSGLKDRLNEQELLYQERLFQLLQATGNLKIQKSLAESQIKNAELLVENAEVDLEKYRDGDAPLLIKTVEARSSVLAEQVRIAAERYARTQELFKTGNASKSELEADALTLKREQLALGQYQEDLRLIKKFDQPNQIRLLQSNVQQAKAELDRLRQRTSNEIAQAEADLKTSDSALDYLEENIETLKQRLENAKIYAPQNGLVVYASVSPFQFGGGDERRRDESRFRGGRGGRDEGAGEFRGGRRGGNRLTSESTPEGISRSSVAETVASGNQRIASAISGSSATEPSGGGASSGGGSSGVGSGSQAGGRSGGGGGGGGGQNTATAAGAFASYPSMRPASAFGASGGTSNSTTSGTALTATSSSTATGGQNSSPTAGNQVMSRSSSQGFRDFGGFEVFGTPGLLEEGTMVRQRQELIRLPDVSKMLAEVKIEEARVRQVRSGMTAYVQVRNIPHRRFKGTLRRVAILPDAQSSWLNPNVKLFPADILIDEELPLLRPGVSATAEIIITNLPQVLSVPIQAVARLRGDSVCFVKQGPRVKPVPVTTGLYNDSFVEITSGLKEGDLVLLAPKSDDVVDETSGSETNKTEVAPDAMPRATSRPEALPGHERRFQRPNEDLPEGSPPGERRRSRQGSRRPQGSSDVPE